MEHVQGVKALPRTIIDEIALALFGQIGYGKVGSRGEELVIVFISGGQPLRGTIGENFLQKRGATPLIKIRVFSKEWLEEEVDGRAARCVQKRNFRRVGVGDSVPILQAFDELLGARVFGLRGFRGRQ